eukprot:gene18785-biopygen11330
MCALAKARQIGPNRQKIKREDTMFKGAIRLLIGLFGALSLVQASRLWLSPHIAVGVLGLTDLNSTGLATARADLGGIFVAIGLLMLYGAARNNRAALTGGLVVVASAFAGRIFAAWTDGLTSAQQPPLVIEAILVTLLLVGRQLAPKS